MCPYYKYISPVFGGELEQDNELLYQNQPEDIGLIKHIKTAYDQSLQSDYHLVITCEFSHTSFRHKGDTDTIKGYYTLP